MALLKTNVIVPVRGTPRRIVVIRENSKGDLYLTYPVLRGGEDPAGPLVRELRVSLHPSWKGSHTTIKQQTQLRTGEALSDPVFASTTAARNISENRFFPIRGDLLPTLESEIYDWQPPKRTSEQMIFNDLDTKAFTGALITLVGPPHIPFPVDDCIKVFSRLFQVVFLLRGFQIPATTFSERISVKTPQLDHRGGIDDVGLGLLELMGGLYAAQALAFADLLAYRLILAQLNKLRQLVKEEEPLPLEEYFFRMAQERAAAVHAPVRQLIWPPGNFRMISPLT